MKTKSNVKEGWAQLNHNKTMVCDAKESNADKGVDSNKPTRDSRIKLPVILYLRRPVNSYSYKREVQTENVSRFGACVVCDVKLELGAMLEVYGIGGKFSAIAKVCHVERRRDGKWSIGLWFLMKTGKWIIG